MVVSQLNAVREVDTGFDEVTSLVPQGPEFHMLRGKLLES